MLASIPHPVSWEREKMLTESQHSGTCMELSLPLLHEVLDSDDGLLVYLPQEGFQALSLVFKHCLSSSSSLVPAGGRRPSLRGS